MSSNPSASPFLLVAPPHGPLPGRDEEATGAMRKIMGEVMGREAREAHCSKAGDSDECSEVYGGYSGDLVGTIIRESTEANSNDPNACKNGKDWLTLIKNTGADLTYLSVGRYYHKSLCQSY